MIGLLDIVALIVAGIYGLWMIQRLGQSARFGLVVILLLYFIETLSGGLPPLAASLNIFAPDIVFVVVFLATALRLVRSRDAVMSPIVLLWLALGISVLISLLVGISLHGTRAGVTARPFFYFWVTALYFMTFRLSVADFYAFRQTILYSALSLCVLVLARWTSDAAGLSNFTVYGAGVPFRVVSSDAAHWISIAAIFIYCSKSKSMTRQRLWLLIFFLTVVLMLRHRSVWLSTIVAFASIPLLSARNFVKHVGRYFGGAVLFTIGLSVASLFASGQVALLAISKSLSSGIDLDAGTTYARIAGWKALLERWQDSSLVAKLIGFPYGTGTARFIIHPVTHQVVEQDFSAHNFYIQTTNDLGIIGALLCFAVFAFALRIAWGNRGSAMGQIENRTLIVALISCLVYFVAYQASYLDGIILGATFGFYMARAKTGPRQSLSTTSDLNNQGLTKARVS